MRFVMGVTSDFIKPQPGRYSRRMSRVLAEVAKLRTKRCNLGSTMGWTYIYVNKQLIRRQELAESWSFSSPRETFFPKGPLLS